MDNSLIERAAAAERDYADTAARAFVAADAEYQEALAAFQARQAGGDVDGPNLVGAGERHFDARAAAEHYLGAICREYVAAAARAEAAEAERDAATKQGRNAIALLLAVRGVLRQLSHRVHSGYDFNADPDGMTLRVGRVEDWTTWLAPLEENVAPDVLDTIDALKAQVAQLTGQLELRDRDAKSSAAGWVATEAENERLRAQVSEYARAFGEFGTEELRMFVSMDSLLAATAPAPAVRDHAAAEARMAELEARLRLYDGTYQCLSDEINRWKEQAHVLASQCSGLMVDVAQLREALVEADRQMDIASTIGCIKAQGMVRAAVHDHAAVVAERDALRAQAGRLREIVAGWQKLHSRFAFRGGAWPMVEEEAKHLLSCSGAALAATAPAGEEANRG